LFDKSKPTGTVPQLQVFRSCELQEVVHSALTEQAEVAEASDSEGRTEWTPIRMSLPEAHAGRLWATACKPHGALFQFTIPAEQATVL
jgi:K+-sensing histidine kinase KdpD